MTAKNVATVPTTNLPQSYAITKSTPIMVPLIREALSNAKGKIFSVDDLKKLLGRKWVHGFVFYASREKLDPNSDEAFPIVAVKRGRKVVGYRYGGAQDNIKRNAKGHPVKPTNIIGKWESKLTQRALNAAKAAGVEIADQTSSVVSNDDVPVNVEAVENNEVADGMIATLAPALDAEAVEAEPVELQNAE